MSAHVFACNNCLTVLCSKQQAESVAVIADNQCNNSTVAVAQQCGKVPTTLHCNISMPRHLTKGWQCWLAIKNQILDCLPETFGDC